MLTYTIDIDCILLLQMYYSTEHKFDFQLSILMIKIIDSCAEMFFDCKEENEGEIIRKSFE